MNGPSCPSCGAALRQCPVCSAIVADTPGPGRKRVYCSQRCRWRAGHIAARDRADSAEPLTGDELLDAIAALAWTPGRQ